jgi:phosphatidylcholine synthase
MARENFGNTPRNKGYAVHLFTASGAVLGMLALNSVNNGDARGALLWLVASQILDGLDGPIARRFDVKIHAPRIDGNTLDLVIDYVTCVVVPTIFILQFNMLPDSFEIPIAGLIFVSSALWFSRPDLETSDFWFRGFPAVWNLAVATMFIFDTDPVWVLVISILLSFSQFTSFQMPHIIRARWMRPITLPFGTIYIAALIYLSARFEENDQIISEIAHVILLAFPIYVLVISSIKTFIKPDQNQV